MSCPWCWAWEIGSWYIFSGYCNKILDVNLANIVYFLMLYFYFSKPWAGFVSQGNEFSYYMLICSNFILNQYVTISNIRTMLFILRTANDLTIFISTQEANEWSIYPWIHSNCNSLSDNDQLRPVSFPDIHPSRCLL
jgi:hypothetical protein